MPRQRSLFRKTAITIAVALLSIQLIVVVTMLLFMMLPMAKRSADDLAALLVLSAQTWVELPPETRNDFEMELAQKHGFMLYADDVVLPPRTGFYPYLALLDDALSARLGHPVSVKVTQLDRLWFWAEIPTGDKLIRIGFPHERLETNPPATLVLGLAATVILTLLTALILARRVSRPLSRLSAAAKRIGSGETPEIVPDTGIRELSDLANTLNEMSHQVRELLDNRTTLLAGISHDLRTPLARIRLAVEMLPENADPHLVSRLKHDVTQMDQLIDQFLALSRELQQEAPQQLDLNELLTELVEDAREEGASVELKVPEKVDVLAGRMALHRILANLLSNAVRYGNDQPITVQTEVAKKEVRIRILDRGVGIPADELESVFRPFYRREPSRNPATGGSGLGLAIARQLASANGWKVSLHPRPGGGLEARLILPDCLSKQH